jgi:hypothetical protein
MLSSVITMLEQCALMRSGFTIGCASPGAIVSTVLRRPMVIRASSVSVAGTAVAPCRRARVPVCRPRRRKSRGGMMRLKCEFRLVLAAAWPVIITSVGERHAVRKRLWWRRVAIASHRAVGVRHCARSFVRLGRPIWRCKPFVAVVRVAGLGGVM